VLYPWPGAVSSRRLSPGEAARGSDSALALLSSAVTGGQLEPCTGTSEATEMATRRGVMEKICISLWATAKC